MQRILIVLTTLASLAIAACANSQGIPVWDAKKRVVLSTWPNSSGSPNCEHPHYYDEMIFNQGLFWDEGDYCRRAPKVAPYNMK